MIGRWGSVEARGNSARLDLIVGPPRAPQRVGKTSLVQRYVRGTFTPSTTASTVGASFLTKRVLDVDSGTTVRLQLWDTAGQERFRSISKLYYRGVSAILLVYSIIDEHSFDEMGSRLKQIKEHIVGAKSDVVAQDPSRRMVPFERCIAYGAENLYSNQMSATPPSTGVLNGHTLVSKRSSGFCVKTLGGTAAMRSAPEMERESTRSFSSLLGRSPWRKSSGLNKNRLTNPARPRVTRDRRTATLTDPALMAKGVSE
ncbi:MAG: hypothetical protein Q9210_000395 [Variospora velana]